MKRPEQDGIRHAEYRGVRADSERKRRDGSSRETGISSQHLQTKPQILPQTPHHTLRLRHIPMNQ